MTGEKILIIDDDKPLAAAIARRLSNRGYTIVCAQTGAEGRAAITREKPDLVILDLILPDEDGLDICRDVRRVSALPIIILTARAEEMERVVGLELGADDYVTKPFSLAELAARVKALLRRFPPREQEREPGAADQLEAAGIVLDLRTRDALVGDEPVPLTPIEFSLLLALMRDPGRVVSSQQLAMAAWGRDVTDKRALAVHITNLRAKLARHFPDQQVVANVRSFGYRLETPQDDGTAPGDGPEAPASIESGRLTATTGAPIRSEGD